MLALLLFPLGKKAVHEVGHLKELHCNVIEKHFCAIEHDCQLCDYVFSSQAIPPEVVSTPVFFSHFTGNYAEELVFNTLIPAKCTFSLRGPPVV